jgi:hypothetical protein
MLEIYSWHRDRLLRRVLRMNTNHALFRPTAYMVIFAMLAFFMPAPAVYAGLIGTEEVITAERTLEARAQVHDLLTREDVRAELERFGISSEEARARVDSLTDAELMQLAGKLDQLPAGGSDALAVLGFIVVVVIILELLGVTNLLPFIRSVR